MTPKEAEIAFYSELDKMAEGAHYKDIFFDWIDWTLKLFERKLDDIPSSENDKKYFKMLSAFGILCEDFTDALGDVFMSRTTKCSRGSPENRCRTA